MSNQKTAEEKLETLYGELSDLIPEALAEDFIGAGYAKGKDYEQEEIRILVVEKVPRPKEWTSNSDVDRPDSASSCCGAEAWKGSSHQGSTCSCGGEDSSDEDCNCGCSCGCDPTEKSDDAEGDVAGHRHGSVPYGCESEHIHKNGGDGHEQRHITHPFQKEDEKDFTGVVSRIARHIFGTKDAAWQDRVAWTYLYKLAPKVGKPDEFIYKKQKSLCEEIIKAEIEVLNPTHVLFFAGWGSVWDFDLPLTPVLKGDAVEALGQTEDGKQLIVTRYAVRKPEDKFVLGILEKMEI